MPAIHLQSHPHSHPFAGLTSLASFTPANLNKFFHSSTVNDFHFVIGETPLSTWWTPFTVIPIYLILIRLTQKYVEYRGKPFRLNGLFFIHNALLSFGSLILCLPLLYDMINLIYANGFWAVFCDDRDRYWYGRHYWIYYINYMFKFIELFDTILLALRGKNLLFLHVYHHAATLLLCWNQLRDESCMQFIPIIINLLIHVLMYSYYAAATLKIKVPWKRYLTLTQIIQFIFGISAAVVALGSLSLYINGYGPEYGGYKCHGEFGAAYFGIAILLSYLLLFIKFYFDSYRQRKAAKITEKKTE